MKDVRDMSTVDWVDEVSSKDAPSSWVVTFVGYDGRGSKTGEFYSAKEAESAASNLRFSGLKHVVVLARYS